MTKTEHADDSQPLWRLSPHAMRGTAMHRFMQQTSARHNFAPEYDALYRWSIDDRAAFWSEVWEFTAVRASRRCECALENADAMPGAQWFTGARLNFAENLLRYRDDQTAILFSGEEETNIREITYRQLYAEVARVTAGLRSLGVQPGDRVACYLPNCPEAIVAMLSAAALGAVWSSCSPDFGVKGVLERFAQIQPRVLFAADGYRYNGKAFDKRDAVTSVAAGLDNLECVVTVPFLNDAPDWSALRNQHRVISFNEFAATKNPATKNPADKTVAADKIPDINFAQLPFDHPLYILYSSGTTGAPKCIVHGAGGTLLQHLKEHQLHTDIGRADRMFFFTTCGWMMWNWLVSGLASGCALVLYDGAPLFPDPGRLWRLAEQTGISVFGAGARYFASLAKAGARPGAQHDLSKLRAVLSTGSPLAAESFDYIYRRIKSDLLLASVSGGTDIVSCFVLGNPLRPVYRGEIQGPGLGMAVDIFDAGGRSLREQRGELVCVKPFPSMPLGFWNEPDGRRYHDAYFARFNNVWAHGDYAEITARDGVIIHGRSDAVLNPGGVRIGTAEIYRQVEKVDEVLESLCIGQAWEGDTRIVLFVMLRDGAKLTDELKTRIRDTVAANTSRRHAPKKIIAVPDIPRTLSGKIVELAARKAVHGEAVENTEALANPEALQHFRDLAELQEA